MVLRKLFFLLALGSPALVFGTTIGSTETTCPTASLAVYAGLGSGGCLVSGVLYNNFSFLSGFSNGATPTPISSSILISPNSAAGGLDFAYPVVTRNFVSFAVQYDFDPPPVAGGTLELDVMGDVDVFETICPGGRFSNTPGGCFGRPGDTAPVNLEVFNQHLGGTKLIDSAVISPAVTNGEVQLYFSLNGLPSAPAGFDKLGTTLSSGIPTPVPEPKTLALLTGGFLLMCGVQVSSRFSRKRCN